MFYIYIIFIYIIYIIFIFTVLYLQDDGDLLTQLKDQDASVIATDKYKDRVSMAENSSLLIAAATLKDEKTFTCMVVAGADISEYPVKLLIHSGYIRAIVQPY